jgi:hypothetical protein
MKCLIIEPLGVDNSEEAVLRETKLCSSSSSAELQTPLAVLNIVPPEPENGGSIAGGPIYSVYFLGIIHVRDLPLCVWLQVPLSAVLGTGLFSAAETCNALSPDRMRHAEASSAKFEHSAKSFVYRARAPFHPARLHAFAQRFFYLQQQDWSAAIASGAPGRAAAMLRRASALAQDASAILKGSGGGAAAAAQLAADAATLAAVLAAAGAEAAAADDGEEEAAAEAEVDAGAAQAAGQAREEAFGKLVRSKGFVWLAGPCREGHCGEWSSAGNILRIGSGGPWFAELPMEAWPTQDKAKQAEILRDFEPGCGDRCDQLEICLQCPS